MSRLVYQTRFPGSTIGPLRSAPSQLEYTTQTSQRSTAQVHMEEVHNAMLFSLGSCTNRQEPLSTFWHNPNLEMPIQMHPEYEPGCAQGVITPSALKPATSTYSTSESYSLSANPHSTYPLHAPIATQPITIILSAICTALECRAADRLKLPIQDNRDLIVQILQVLHLHGAPWQGPNAPALIAGCISLNCHQLAPRQMLLTTPCTALVN